MTTQISGNCVDFFQYPDDTDLGMEFTLGWFSFIALEKEYSYPYVYHGANE